MGKELSDLDVLVNGKATGHWRAQTLVSIPGFGLVLASVFLGAADGN